MIELDLSLSHIVPAVLCLHHGRALPYSAHAQVGPHDAGPAHLCSGAPRPRLLCGWGLQHQGCDWLPELPGNRHAAVLGSVMLCCNTCVIL